MPTPPAVRHPRGRWSSFIADPSPDPSHVLHEAGNPAHRLSVEHDGRTLLVHLSDEDSSGWTVIAVDRASRRWAVAQGTTQARTAERAYEQLNESAEATSGTET